MEPPGVGPAVPAGVKPLNLTTLSRSPALIGTSMVFSGGASGHTQRGSYRHDGWYMKLKSMTIRWPSDPRSAPFAVSSR